jgi:hypothetical protein
MLKIVAGGILSLLLLTTGAAAQSCSGATWTPLTNGNLADASQVMNNFTCVLSSPTFSGNVYVGTSGNAYIGTATYVYSPGPLQVESVSDTLVAASFHGNGYSPTFPVVGVATADSGTSYAMGFFDGAASAVVGSIAVTSSATSYNTTSDRRVKTDINPLGAAISLKALKAYDPSDYLLRGKYAVGAVAQWVDRNMKAIGIDAAEIGLVTRGDSDIYRKPTNKDFRQWQMDSGKMMPYVIRTILDQEKRIEALKKENDRLSAQMTAMAGVRQNQKTADVRVEDTQRLKAANDEQAVEVQNLKMQIGALEKRISSKIAQN